VSTAARRSPSRPSVLLAACALALVLAGAAQARVDAAQTVRFSAIPQRVAHGAVAKIEVRVLPSGARCTAAVRYADGRLQGGLTARVARYGKAAWQWRIPDGAPGPARVTVACGRAGSVTRSMALGASTYGTVKVVVEQQGFSQRPNPTTGSTVSFGIVLANQSDRDAHGVTVLVNMLDAANRVLGSSNVQVGALPAASPYYLGNAASLTTAEKVERLEIVIRVDGSAPRGLHLPAADNLRFVASAWDPGWLSAVAGEVINLHQTMLLSTTKISLVIFDDGGRVIGGTAGSTFAPLAPNARVFFQATSGMRAVELSRAASVMASFQPTYRNMG